MSAYQRLAVTPDADPAPLIDRFPLYNKPLFERFTEPRWRSHLTDPDAYRAFHGAEVRAVRDREQLDVPPALALEVFRRRTTLDGGGVFEVELLERAAWWLRESGHPVDGPVAPLVHDLAEHGTAGVDLGDAWYETGRRWEAAGTPARAFACYENAIREHAGENDGEWHRPAGHRLRELAAALGDPHYLAYLEPALAYLDKPDDEDG